MLELREVARSSISSARRSSEVAPPWIIRIATSRPSVASLAAHSMRKPSRVIVGDSSKLARHERSERGLFARLRIPEDGQFTQGRIAFVSHRHPSLFQLRSLLARACFSVSRRLRVVLLL